MVNSKLVLALALAWAGLTAKAQFMPGGVMGGNPMQQEITPAQSPQWLTPANMQQVNDKVVVEIDPKACQFTWTPPVMQVPTARVVYNIKFVELFEGQYSEQAIDHAPTIFERKGLMAPTFVFSPSLIPGYFQIGKTYVVRVTAEVSGAPGFTTSQLIQNNGKSDLLLFTIK